MKRKKKNLYALILIIFTAALAKTLPTFALGQYQVNFISKSNATYLISTLSAPNACSDYGPGNVVCYVDESLFNNKMFSVKDLKGGVPCTFKGLMGGQLQGPLGDCPLFISKNDNSPPTITVWLK